MIKQRSAVQRQRGWPALLVLCLCAAGFWGGRWVARDPDRGAQGAAVEGRRVVDPLDPASLQRHLLKGSGLLQARPALVPGASGETAVRAVPFQVLSWFPRIVLFPAFLDAASCQHVITLARARLAPSELAYRPGERGNAAGQQTRTSKGTFLEAADDPAGVLHAVEERIASVTRLPMAHGEAFNVLKYERLATYESHMDSFDPREFGPQPSQRIATVLVYLSDVAAGGETIFKKEGLHGVAKPVTDFRTCEPGAFKYVPRQGDALLFWGVTPNLEIDSRALHGGCPVLEGEKWVMTKWVRSKPLG